MRRLFIFILLSLVQMALYADNLIWFDGTRPVTYFLETPKADPVVSVAIDMFSSDMLAVTGHPAQCDVNGIIRLVELDRASKNTLRQLRRWDVPVDKLLDGNDGFHVSVHAGRIVVVGSNGRGTAYGLLELSRLAGVSPWVWWGDVRPEHKERLSIPTNFNKTEQASVTYRGIFLNDEDWSLRNWSCHTYEPSATGMIGSKTYRRVCELLLRLRANALWPAMHPGTQAFFLTPGAKAVCDSCGIVIGTSHCEPMLRNNVGEWDVKQRGPFNYITNKDAVQRYWAERLDEVKGSAGGNMFTIGMRGIHDGSMEGVRTMEEKTKALQQVIDDQQELIRHHIGDPKGEMQVFVPYKEVLQIYERGLRVPDCVTLMWCDDNYGYLTYLSNKEEQLRPGGAGVYYHLSYWGRPHDYLWLTTTQPGLVAREMRTAFDRGARRLWIANVHDPKVAGYDLELFLDMAWNVESVSLQSVGTHYKNWLVRQFGEVAASRLYPAMRRFYQLTGERKPEFMGWSQVELDKRKFPNGLSPMLSTDFSTQSFGDELHRYLDDYAAIAREIRDAAKLVRPELRDAYFASVLYPVCGAAAMARKTLYAQLAKESDLSVASASVDSMLCARSLEGYRDIAELTRHYNEHLAEGKWNGLMSMHPRDLPVFLRPQLPLEVKPSDITRLCAYAGKKPEVHQFDACGAIARNACQWQKASDGANVTDMLGHSMKAVSLSKGDSLVYRITTEKLDSAILRIALIPTQPLDGGELRFSVKVDGGIFCVFSLKEPFRSETWKLSVLRGQALKSLVLPRLAAGEHTLVVKALDDNIIVDQWMIDPNPGRRFYLFPIQR